jgi:UDP-GlcNAc3NAcA epimerase
MKILSVVGARPEFIQAMPVSRTLRRNHHEILVHTGQHYDYQLSQVFFDELEIPEPDYCLEVGSGSHGQQTAGILVRLEEVLQKERPDLVIVRGDTNSTLGAALAASKAQIPLAHIEAGERSFQRRMPEEINRLATDHLADLHFCASELAVHHLSAEGIKGSVHWVGDVMLDAMILAQPVAHQKSVILAKLELRAREYALVTVHRPANTDDPQRLRSIVSALNAVPEPVVFPAHPRTKKALESIGARFRNHIRLIEPVGFLDQIVLEENARLIATDSGGVQREAYFLGIPCLTLRDETEWVGTISAGWNRLVGAETDRILEGWFGLVPPAERPLIFGDGRAAKRIAVLLETGGSGPGQQQASHMIALSTQLGCQQ